MKKGPEFKRRSSTRQKFLKSKGLTKTPAGKKIDHRESLWRGGTDSTRNLVLRKTGAHKRKTAKETRERARKRKK